MGTSSWTNPENSKCKIGDQLGPKGKFFWQNVFENMWYKFSGIRVKTEMCNPEKHVTWQALFTFEVILPNNSWLVVFATLNKHLFILKHCNKEIKINYWDQYVQTC
jgi:hypothetical protein